MRRRTARIALTLAAPWLAACAGSMAAGPHDAATPDAATPDVATADVATIDAATFDAATLDAPAAEIETSIGETEVSDVASQQVEIDVGIEVMEADNVQIEAEIETDAEIAPEIAPPDDVTAIVDLADTMTETLDVTSPLDGDPLADWEVVDGFVDLGDGCLWPAGWMGPGGPVFPDAQGYGAPDGFTPPPGDKPCMPTAPIMALPGAVASPLEATGTFVEVTPALPLGDLGVDPGTIIGPPPGASVASLDADGDGDIDLAWTDGVGEVRLLEQIAPWQFVSKPLAKVGAQVFTAVAAIDPDGNGVPAIVAAGSVVAVFVRGADGGYTDQAQDMGFKPGTLKVPIQSVLPVDLNDDGHLDLLFGLWGCDKTQPALAAYVWRGAGGFENQTSQLGLATLQGQVWAVLASDPDGDGRQDLFVLPDSCPYGAGPARFVRDKPGGAWTMGPLSPLFMAPFLKKFGTPMAGTAADLNGDGKLDYLFGEIEAAFPGAETMQWDPPDLNDFSLVFTAAKGGVNDLLLSQPDGSYAYAALWAGIAAPLSQTGVPMTAWSDRLVDLDHDGHLDVVISHGYHFSAWVVDDLGGMRPTAFRNDGTNHFKEMSVAWGLPGKHAARTMLMPDLDGDGDLDLVFGGQAVPPRIFRNDLSHKGSDLALRLVGRASNAWGLGARVTLTSSARTILLEHGVHAISQGMEWPVTHVALAPQEVMQSMTITWPSGWIQSIPLPADSTSGTLVTAVEPVAVSLDTAWSPLGANEVTVQVDCQSAGVPCDASSVSIALASGQKGTWKTPASCSGGVCTRTWQAGWISIPGSAAVVVTIAGQELALRPRIFF